MKTLIAHVALMLVLLCNARAELPDTAWTVNTYPYPVNYVNFTSDSKYVISSGGYHSTIYEASTGKSLRVFDGTIYTDSLNLPIENRFLPSISGNSISVIELETGKQKFLDCNSYLQSGIAKSWAFGNNNQFLFGSFVRQDTFLVLIWDVNTWQIIDNYNGIYGAMKVAASNDGQFLAIGMYSTNPDKDYQTYLYKIKEKKLIAQFTGIKSQINCLQFSMDNKMLAIGAMDGTVKLWNLQELTLINTIKLDDLVQSISFSNDIKYMILGSGSVFDLFRLKIYNIQKNTIGYSYNLDYITKKIGINDRSDIPWALSINSKNENIVAGGAVGIYYLNAKWEPTSIQDDNLNFFQIKTYPNPISASITIEYVIPYPNVTLLEIFDINGNKIKEIIHNFENEGKHIVNWDISQISSGIYICRLTSGNKAASINISIIK
ncbi:MAG: hypothetical protein HW421_3962 [Ignavibacteria bacterium]|nr:hypothetical protein [Ignavibacteria bacterium]